MSSSRWVEDHWLASQLIPNPRVNPLLWQRNYATWSFLNCRGEYSNLDLEQQTDACKQRIRYDKNAPAAVEENRLIVVSI